MPPSPVIAVLGLGHVGMVQAACLAEAGQHVVAFDRDPARRQAVAGAHCPIVEPGLPALIEAAVNNGALRVCGSIDEAVHAAEISIICVGTSSADGSEIDIGDLLTCLDGIAGALSAQAARHSVIIRSTLPAGAMRQHALPRLAAAGAEIACLYIPEFMREGNALNDYRSPSRIIVGCPADDGRSEQLVELIYRGIPSPRHFVDYEMAELAKLADNAWHALKICFANEVGALSAAFGVDGQRLMEIFRQDRSLNISEAYLRPGMPFGGSCLPKDVAAVDRLAAGDVFDLPLLASVVASNDRHIDRCASRVCATKAARIGVWGLTFKPTTDDLRGSPALALVARLLAEGRQLALHDEKLAPAALAARLRSMAPGFADALDSRQLRIEGAAGLDECEALVLCHPPGETVAARPGQRLVPLFR